MNITNNTNRVLGLPCGTVLRAGKTVEVESLNESHPVVKAWFDSGAIKANKEKPLNKLNIDEIKEKLDELEVDYEGVTVKADLLEILLSSIKDE